MGFSSWPFGPVRDVDPRELPHFAQLQIANIFLQIAEDQIRSAGRVYGDKIVFLGHRIQSADDAGLIAHEAVEHIATEANIHAAFPKIECAAAQDHTRDQIFDLRPQIVSGVRYQPESKHLLDPTPVLAARYGAS